jgi:hypothetical protein
LTHQQIEALRGASIDKPVYGKDPSLWNTQTPDDAACFSLRSIEALEKRGYLKSDGKGGHLLTAEGAAALRSALGF